MKSLVAKKLSVILLMTVVAVPSAWGDEASRRDRDEAGSQMKLDVARISHGHRRRERSRLLLHVVRFQDDVESRDFYGGFGGLQLFFDVDADKAYERSLRFFLNPDGSVTPVMQKPGPRVVGFANWWRPDPRTVKIEFPRSLLGNRVRNYRWRVGTAQNEPCEPDDPDGLQADGCFDGTRSLTHDL